MAKALVTGASGHVGNNLVRTLLAEGREVRAFVRQPGRPVALAGLDVEVVHGDMTDLASVERACRGCTTVYHAAAAFAMWARNPAREIIDPTVQGVKNVLSAAAKYDVDRVIYVSTSGTLGFKPRPEPISEDDPPHRAPVVPYLVGKCRAEQYTLEFFQRHSLPVVLVLPGFILGANVYRLTPSVKLVWDFLDGHLPFFCGPVSLYFDGGMSVVDVRDVAAGCLLAERRGKPGERYLLGGENVTVREFLTLLAHLTGLLAPTWKILPTVGRLLAYLFEGVARLLSVTPPFTRAMVEEFAGQYVYLDSSKARGKLSYTFRPKEEVVYDTVAWLLAHGFIRESRQKKIRLTKVAAMSAADKR